MMIETIEKPRRRGPRLSLRTLMVLVLLIGGVLGWKANRARTQRLAVAAVKAAGGGVLYDYQYPNNGKPKPKGPAAPEWLRGLLGDEYFQEVKLVSFTSPVASGDLAAVGSLDHLESFFIGDSSMMGDVLSHLRGLRHLKIVHLTGQGITDERLADLPSSPALATIMLQRTAVTDAGLVRFLAQPQLESLSISPALGVTDEGIKTLAKLPRLRYLMLAQCPRVTDLAFENLRPRLPEMEALWLNGSGITDAGLVHLKEMPRLKSLQLQATKVTDIGLANLAATKGLRSLYLAITALTDRGMETIRTLEDLHSLFLNKTQITDAGLARLDRTKHLIELGLANNPAITDAAADQVAGWTELSYLNFSRTKLTDVGLAKLASLKSLKTLDVGDTQVTGQGIAALRSILPSVKVRGGATVPKPSPPK